MRTPHPRFVSASAEDETGRRSTLWGIPASPGSREWSPAWRPALWHVRGAGSPTPWGAEDQRVPGHTGQDQEPCPPPGLARAGRRLQTPGRAAALALRLGVPPATLVILPAPWPRHPTPGLGRGCCSTSLPPKETGGRAPWGSRGPELGPCTPRSSDPWPEPPPPAALPLRGPAPPTEGPIA